VIVAAGESRRMGALKPLLPFGPHSVIEQVVAIARDSGLSPLVVVLGHEAERIATRLPADAHPAYNADYREGGMFSSVCRGIREVPEEAAGVVLFVGDNVTLTPEVVRSLRSAWETEGRPQDRFYIPTFEGIWGHPVVITAGLLPTVLGWCGERGLRGAMEAHAAQITEVPVPESGIGLDIDTPEDYARALAWLEARQR
jgi:CTP:molybdopterin cytidylyltransferase MocA